MLLSDERCPFHPDLDFEYVAADGRIDSGSVPLSLTKRQALHLLDVLGDHDG